MLHYGVRTFLRVLIVHGDKGTAMGKDTTIVDKYWFFKAKSKLLIKVYFYICKSAFYWPKPITKWNLL